MSRNVLVTFGGGEVDPAKNILMQLGKNVYSSKKFEKVYMGKYSFESFYNTEYLLEYGEELEKLVADKRGAYFGTCRDIDLVTDQHKMNRSIFCLKQNNIDTILVVGGDGTARQVAEISEVLNENGINIIYAIPLTIDGINGGESIGLEQATRESVRQIENMVATSLETKSEEKFGVVIIELQGRNRDDIMVESLLYFLEKEKIADNDLNDVLLIVVPANIKSDINKLVEEVNSSSQKTVILLSEGAKVKLSTLKKRIKRKVRTFVVGHPSQSNNMTTEEDIKKYNIWVNSVADYILCNLDHSYCMVKRKNMIWEVPIDYYAKLNPRKKQIPEMDAFSKYWLEKFMAK